MSRPPLLEVRHCAEEIGRLGLLLAAAARGAARRKKERAQSIAPLPPKRSGASFPLGLLAYQADAASSSESAELDSPPRSG
jgi:hypothetical protein